jgi:DNA-directed RNA polymerase beta subunit
MFTSVKSLIMKKEFFYYLLFSVFFFSNCNSKSAEKKGNELIVLDAEKNEIKIDTTLLAIADLPIKMDSVSYLMHPIGNYRTNRYNNEYVFKSSRSGSEDFTLTTNYGDEIKGNMFNLLFQKENSAELKVLTDKNIKIKSVLFLRALFNNTKKQILIYEIVDTDTNEDKDINLLDLHAIYLSDIDGSNFRKISKSNHRIINTKFVKSNNRFYFKTIEKFTLKEVFHYYYIDLSKNDPKVEAYFPLKSK